MKNQPIHPCIGCIYFKACGETTRTMPCDGRMTKSEKKEGGQQKMNKYTSLKAKHQKEVDAFPFGFAFNQSQFDEMMTKWGLDPKNTGAIFSIGGGGYIRKSDAEAMHKMFSRHEAERKVAMQDDDYLYQMFNYELANHEYSYTYDLTDTLEALGLTIEEINADPRMADTLKKAIAAQED